MRDTSKHGADVLQILALSIRSDQDCGLTTDDSTLLVLRSNINHYRPPYNRLRGFAALRLRHALNKVAHADPTQSGFFAHNNTHDNILSGDDRGENWIAVISFD